MCDMEWLFTYFISQGKIYSRVSLLLKNTFLSFQSQSKQHRAQQHWTDWGGEDVGTVKKEPVLWYFSTKQGQGMKTRTLGSFKLFSALFCCHMLQREILGFGVLVWWLVVFFFPSTFLPLSSASRLLLALQPHQHSCTYCHTCSHVSVGKTDMFHIS